ncbi:MAG: nucleotide exchange factor GrpE [Saprospiraceae bacterium]|nr:nucleotide exchange factor GrpE [Saprospiraceae bacterium]
MSKKKNDTENGEQFGQHDPESDTSPGASTKNLESELAEIKDKYLRLFAEFDNYKKRTARERLDLIRTASEDLVGKLLPVLDDFERAKKNAEDSSSPESFSEGVSLVYQKLHHALESKGLKAMDPEEIDFDPELHEAITKIPAPDPSLKGKIIDVIEKGYYLNDKIIRHAKVVIGE